MPIPLIPGTLGLIHETPASLVHFFTLFTVFFAHYFPLPAHTLTMHAKTATPLSPSAPWPFAFLLPVPCSLLPVPRSLFPAFSPPDPATQNP
jgi:hypothetical protein